MANEPISTLTLRELVHKSFPPDNFIIDEGLLPTNGLMFVAGPPKSYKSFLINTIALHLTLGTNLFHAHRKRPGHITELAFGVVKPQRVLILEQEVGFYDMQQRLLPLWNTLSEPQEAIVGTNLFIHSRDHTMRLDTKDGCSRLGEIIAKVKPNVTVFDPLIEFHVANENDAQGMGAVLHNLDILRDSLGFATIMSHHTGKPDPAKARSGPDLLRGSSVIYGKGDSYLMLTPENRAAGLITVDVTVRRGKPIAGFDLVLDWKELVAKFHKWNTGRNAKKKDDESDDENVQ